MYLKNKYKCNRHVSVWACRSKTNKKSKDKTKEYKNNKQILKKCPSGTVVVKIYIAVVLVPHNFLKY